LIVRMKEGTNSIRHRILAGRSILIVGDERANGSELQAALEHAGAAVAHADWARAGILVERPFLSAVVMASRPSSRARREVIRRLRERCVPFLIYGAEAPATITSGQGAPFIAKYRAAPKSDRDLSLLGRTPVRLRTSARAMRKLTVLTGDCLRRC
jgi:CheY-like chemotaxis protein